VRAVVFTGAGGREVMRLEERPDPVPGTDELLVAARFAGINSADLSQRAGSYPAPPGAPQDVPGLEVAGTVVAVGSAVREYAVGDRVFGLVAGGGLADRVVVHERHVTHVPDNLSDEEAAAIPEVFLTSFLNIFELARAERGETVLIHGGGSGVGTAATTLCKLAGMRVIVTAGSDEKCARCLGHGADVAINYRTEDFVEKARGANVILDHIGARYLPRDLDALATGGRIVIIGSMGGDRAATIDVVQLLGKRARIIGSTLRARPVEEKAAIVSSFVARFGADLDAGRIRPVIHAVLPLERTADAHELMASSEHFGKIVLGVHS
jgi:putative PIG3 family NAD(P)H quinone oxidoreductase